MNESHPNDPSTASCTLDLTKFCSSASELARSNEVGILEDVSRASRAFVLAGESLSLRIALSVALQAPLKTSESASEYNMLTRCVEEGDRMTEGRSF